MICCLADVINDLLTEYKSNTNKRVYGHELFVSVLFGFEKVFEVFGGC